MTRDERIDREALGLWRALRDGPPPAGVHGGELLSMLIGQSGAPPYERLHSPYLRDSQITRPPSRS
ncbi:hypothetical protein [Phenylobacterium sp.]|uniref:hypothetical protein n=1 Tax=Phenylobacterium sp. TaxID=1871053 RepID=UPI002715DA88|nr:hypothetical protein [Phenylobacterium sp.]MDO8377467.1 hypothetical protein [Phenylobacterium sp.]